MKTIAIMLDMDGCFSDWGGYMLGNHFPDFKDIDVLNKHPDRDKLIGDVYKGDPHAFYKLPVLDGAAEFYQRLVHLAHRMAAAGHRLHLNWLTAVGGIHHDHDAVSVEKRLWLGENIHEDWSAYGNFVATVASPDKKVALAQALAVYDHVFFLDDFLTTIKAVESLGPRLTAMHHEGDHSAALACVENHLKENNYF